MASRRGSRRCTAGASDVPTAFPKPQPGFVGNITPRAAVPTGDPRTLGHADLLRLRNSLAPNDPRHAQLAPLEHAAFAREATAENPLSAIPLALAIPAYTGAKAVGLTDARSPATLEEVLLAYQGIGRGLADRFKGNR